MKMLKVTMTLRKVRKENNMRLCELKFYHKLPLKSKSLKDL